jgi:ABC-type Fe3+/spermidine/putrescine transport system ATPase subunit
MANNPISSLNNLPPVALSLRDVCKTYGDEAALNGLSLTVNSGEYLTILGPSGAGKSTLLRVIAGFERPDAGLLAIAGQSMLGTPPNERGVGFVFQNFALFPHLNVFDNVAFGLRNRTLKPLQDEVQVKSKVDAMLALVGLSGLGGREIAQISGGQKQRVALARSLVGDPSVVLLDEPLGALDANLREQMMGELKRIHEELGCTFLHVTGNEQEAIAMGTRVAVMSEGRMVQIDSPDVIFERPATVEVARLLNCHNILDGQVRFALPARGAEADSVAYCIRTDRVRVTSSEDLIVDAAMVFGTFIAQEYAGSRVLSFFDIGAARPFEVEYHLGHERPSEFVAGRRYAMQWAANDALLFPAAQASQGQPS